MDKLEYYAKHQENFEKLAQGIIAGVKLHGEDYREIARYIAQYVVFREDIRG